MGKGLKDIVRKAKAQMAPGRSSGVHPTDLSQVVKGLQTDKIGNIFTSNSVDALKAIVPFHVDSFLSFLFGKTLNCLAPVSVGAADMSSEGFYKMLYMFLRTVDHLHKQGCADLLEPCVRQVHKAKEHIAERDNARDIMLELIKPGNVTYDEAKDSFEITISGFAAVGALMQKVEDGSMSLEIAPNHIIFPGDEVLKRDQAEATLVDDEDGSADDVLRQVEATRRSIEKQRLKQDDEEEDGDDDSADLPEYSETDPQSVIPKGITIKVGGHEIKIDAGTTIADINAILAASEVTGVIHICAANIEFDVDTTLIGSIVPMLSDAAPAE